MAPPRSNAMSHVREREYRHHFTSAQVMLKKRSRPDECGSKK
jgi:hypothetical protein